MSNNQSESSVDGVVESQDKLVAYTPDMSKPTAIEYAFRGDIFDELSNSFRDYNAFFSEGFLRG